MAQLLFLIVTTICFARTVISADPGGSTAGAGGNQLNGCLPSTLGYACMLQPAARVTVHWTLRSDRNDTATSTGRRHLTQGCNGSGVLDVAVVGQTTGYVGLSFAQGTSMSPADAVIGWMDGTGVASIHGYALHGHDTPNVDSTQVNTNFSVSETGGVTTIKFSRPLCAGNFQVSSNGVNHVNWVLGDTDSLSEHSTSSDVLGRLLVNFGNGTAVAVGPDLKTYYLLHGWLMITGWIVFGLSVPSIARHKKVIGDPLWFHLHRAVVAVTSVLFLAGLIVAWTKLDDGGVTIGSVHSAIAIVMIVMLVLQVLIALFLRPDKKNERRWMWNMVHHNLGRGLVLLAIAQCFIGCKLYNDVTGTNTVGIFVAVAVIVVAHILIAVLAEVRTHRHPHAEAIKTTESCQELANMESSSTL